MGVTGLWALLANGGKRVKPESLHGKRVAVDMSIWLASLAAAMKDDIGVPIANGQLIGVFARCCKLAFFGAMPVFVFDGPAPALKTRTLNRRRREIESRQMEIERTARQLILNRAALRSLSRGDGGRNGQGHETEADVPRPAIAIDEGDETESVQHSEEPPTTTTSTTMSSAQQQSAEIAGLQKQRSLVRERRAEESHALAGHILGRNGGVAKRPCPTAAVQFSKAQIAAALEEGRLNRDIAKARRKSEEDGAPQAVASDSRLEFVYKKDATEESPFTKAPTGSQPLEQRTAAVSTAAKQAVADMEGGFIREDDEEVQYTEDANQKQQQPPKQPQEQQQDLDSPIVIDIGTKDPDGIADFFKELVGNPTHCEPEPPQKASEPIVPETEEIAVGVSPAEDNPSMDEAASAAAAEHKSEELGDEFDNDLQRAITLSLMEAQGQTSGSTGTENAVPSIEVHPARQQSQIHLQSGVLQSSRREIPPSMPAPRQARAVSDAPQHTTFGSGSEPILPIKASGGAEAVLSTAFLELEDEQSRHEEQRREAEERLVRDAAQLLELQKKQTRGLAGNTGGDRQTMNALEDDIATLLELFGIPWMKAPSEADAQCAWLNSEKLVDAVVSDDVDVLLFGADTVFRHLFSRDEFLERYTMDDVKRNTGLDRDNLISLALLLGSDYTDGVGGVGPVRALEVLVAFGSDLSLFKDWLNYDDGVRDKSLERLEQLRKTARLPRNFPSDEVKAAYNVPRVDDLGTEFEWKRPDVEGLRRFAVTRLKWTLEKTDRQLLPVMKIAAWVPMPLKKDKTIRRYFDRDGGGGGGDETDDVWQIPNHLPESASKALDKLKERQRLKAEEGKNTKQKAKRSAKVEESATDGDGGFLH